jgi:hypothetical protein
MLKSTVIGAFVAAGLAAGLGGCATHAPTDKVAANAPNDPSCITSSGTRISDPNRKCVDATGSSYTQQNIQNTGEINTADALKKLDPRLQ